MTARAALAAAALASLLAACKEEEGGASATTSPPPSGLVDAGAGPAEPDASIGNPTFCAGLEASGDPIDEVERRGSPDVTIGGTLVPGVYDLVQATTYVERVSDCVPGPDVECPKLRVTGRATRASLLVETFSMRRVASAGTQDGDGGLAFAPPAFRAFVHAPHGALELATTELCPAPDTRATLGYSASGASLVLVAGAREEIYVRRP